MQSKLITGALYTIVAILIFSAWPAGATAEEQMEEKKQNPGLQQRIDFGNAYILGQSIKSGAVYLLHRKQSEIKGLLDMRQDYRSEIMEDYAIDKTALVSDEKEEPPQNIKK